MLGKLLGLGGGRPTRVPDDLTVYAIGDIHGRLDLLQILHRKIEEAPARGDKLVVYLGDYIDRGPASREVLELLRTAPPAGCRHVFLRGNHEQTMMDFLDDWRIAYDWLNFGGGETLASYGARVPFALDELSIRHMQRDMLERVPANHWDFLRATQINHIEGDFLFVHAGIRPGLPLDRQLPEDMLWIRDTFLSSRADHGKVVVHGHSISEEVEFRPNRIGIDTGAFYTGMLTCLVLHGTGRGLIQT
jgi:serine/threonine protein phosphatase 1